MGVKLAVAVEEAFHEPAHRFARFLVSFDNTLTLALRLGLGFRVRVRVSPNPNPNPDHVSRSQSTRSALKKANPSRKPNPDLDVFELNSVH